VQIVNIRVSGATALLGLRSDLARLLSVDADLRSSFLASDEQVRRVLVEALADPDDMKKLRVFWSQWSGDGQRYVYQSDRSIIDRLADKMLHGPLAIIIYRDETQLFPRRTEFGGNDALFAERALAASSNQFRSTDLTTPTSGGANRFSHEAANPFAPQAANPLAPQGAGPGGQRPGMAGAFTQAGQSAPATSVHAMSIKQRFMETLLRVPNFLTGETKRQFLALLEPTSLEFMAAAFTLWAIGHFFGASEILDAAVLLFGALGVFLMGRSLLDGIEDLFTAIDLVRTADNDRDLDEAASKIAACVVAVGVTTLMALLIHNVAKVTGEFPAKKPSIRQPPPESPPPLEPKLQERPVAEEASGPKLLPSEGNVGTYDDLIAAGTKGDNITPHHIPSANRMALEGVSKGDGIAMNMEQPSPGSGGRHRATFTYGTKADIDMTPRDALATGVRDARQIYQGDGLYTPQIRSSLQELIQMNKDAHPTIFAKPGQ
jgi:hypothetical protein